MFANETTTIDFPTFYAATSLFIGAIVGGLMISYYIKQLFFSKHIEPGQTPITREDFKEFRADADKIHSDLNTKIESARLERTTQLLEMDKKFVNLNEYSHDSIHELKNLMQVYTNRVNLVEQKLDVALSEWLKRLETRLEHLDRGLGNLGSKVSQLIGRMIKDESINKDEVD